MIPKAKRLRNQVILYLYQSCNGLLIFNLGTAAPSSPVPSGVAPQSLFKEPPMKPANPEKKAGTFDDNYQTLNNIEDPFGKAREQSPVAPQDVHKQAGTFDPNYQTLAQIDNDAAFEKKPVGGGVQQAQSPVAPPNATNQAGTFDPNYQTLANVDNNAFVKK